MAEVADEAYIKRCINCSRKIVKPVLYRGYVFCSEKCKNEFMASKNLTKKHK